MTNDGKIYIIVTNKLPAGTSVPTITDGQKTESSSTTKSESLLARYAQHKFFNFIQSQTEQFISYEISNIGNFTGNYVAQRNVDSTVASLNVLTNVATAAYAGFTMSGGNVFGALIGAGVSVISQTVSFLQREKINQLVFRQQNYTLDVLKERSGLYSLDNGSRTGGY